MSPSPAVPRETYLAGKGQEEWMQRHLRQRSGDQWAAFLLPHLRPGLRMLDCGCGPGTITSDLALRVDPGEVVGIDADAKVVEVARAAAVERGQRNVSFEVGDVYALPFLDCSFDVVFANTLVMHLRQPLVALREMFRVLKPGGVAGVSDLDMSTWAHAPEEPAIRIFQEIAIRLLEKGGGSPCYAPSIRKMLIEAGFTGVEGGALAIPLGTAEKLRTLLPLFDQIARMPGALEMVGGAAAKLGATAMELIDRMRTWAGRPDAFFTRVHCTGLGWKPGPDAAR